MMVDGGLRDAEPLGELLHAGPVVAALVEHRDRHGQQRLEVVTRTARTPMGATAGTRFSDHACQPTITEYLNLTERPVCNSASMEEIVTIASVPASVAVIGGGRMGAGIAQVFAAKGARVSVVESDERTAAAAHRR